MTIADKYALGSLGLATLVGAAAYGIAYHRARSRFPGRDVPMNQPPQARYEGAVWGGVFGGSALLLGSGFLRGLGA